MSADGRVLPSSGAAAVRIGADRRRVRSLRDRSFVRCGIVLVAGAVLLGLACCGSEGEVRSRIRADYLAYWKAWLAASTTADPEAPALVDRVAGEQLGVLRQSLRQSRDRGIVARGTVTHRIEQVAVEGKRALLVDCVDLDKWLQYDAKTGALVGRQTIDRPSERARFTLAETPARWKVTYVQPLGPC